jgi:hypothetical protein
MKQLPRLGAGQFWCCSRGCGACGTKSLLQEYSRTEHPNGDVESKAHRVFASTCCGADLMLWDKSKQDMVDWSYVEVPGQDTISVESCGDFLGDDVRKMIVDARPTVDVVPAPEFQLPSGFDIHGLIEQCREAVKYWEPLQSFIDQFDKYLNCELCHGTCVVLAQTDVEDDFPHLDVAYVPCPKCNAETQQPIDPVALRNSLRESAIKAITLSESAEFNHANSFLDGGLGCADLMNQAKADAFLAIGKLLSSVETKERKTALLDELEQYFKIVSDDSSTDRLDRAQALRGLREFESLRKHYE